MIIKPNEIKSSLIKAHMHFSVKNIFEKSKSIFTQSLNVFQSRFTKKLSTIQSTEIQSKCGPLELKGRTLLDKFSDVMKNKQNSIDMQEAEVEHVATSANVTQRSRRSRGSDDEISSTLNNSSVDQELLKIHPSKQLKSNDEGHASATVKPVTKELSMALNNINGNNPLKPHRPVMFSALDLQAVNLKKKSAAIIESSKLPNTFLSSDMPTTNAINNLEFKKPFNVTDILNVKLRSQASNGSEQVSQAALPSNVETSNQAINLESKSVHKSKRPFNINDILNVKLRSQAAPPSTITSNQLNGISSKSIQADNKKPFNINDILNVKLRSRTNELSNSSTDHKKPSVIKVKRKTPIAKISGSIHNSQMSMHSALKQALSKKFKTASRQSINNAEQDSPHSQWDYIYIFIYMYTYI